MVEFPEDLDRVSYFIALSFFACWPGIGAIYSLPKILIICLGLTLCVRGKTPTGPVAAYMVAVLLSTVFSDDVWISLFGRYRDWSQGLWPTLLVIGCYLTGPADRKVLVWAGAATGVLCVWQYFTAVGLPQGPWGPRAMGLVGSPVDCSAILAMLLPIAFYRGSCAVIPLSLGLVACGSRGGILAGGLGLLTLAVARRFHERQG